MYVLILICHVSHTEHKESFEQLFRQYYPVLCRIAYGYVREKSVVEEITNDIFIRYWNNRSRILIRTSIKDYLYKSVQNACIDYLRSEHKRRRQTSYIDEQSIVCATLTDLGENPLEYLINTEMEKRIMKAIEELPDRYRMTFKLCRMDEMSYDEIAETMGISKNTVKSNLRDAMAILKEKLKDLTVLLLLIFDFQRNDQK